MMAASSIPDFHPDFASNSEWAAMYRACGMQVVPARYPMVSKDDKRPSLATWRQFHDDLVADGIFSGWFPGGCHPQMGLIAGRCSRNTVVIDLDVQTKAEAALWWRGQLEIHAMGIEPETWKQTTGGGGRQLFFKTPTDWHAPTNKTPLGVDVRGQGGFAMLPPSRHLSGGVYSWDEGFAPWECELAEAPDWLLEAIDDLVVQFGGDQRAPGGAEYVKHDGPDFDAFAARIDGREDAMRSWVWARLLDLHTETGGQLPEDGGTEALEALCETWCRNTRTRLKGVENVAGLERECRGPTAMREKWRKTLRKWDGQIARDAAERAKRKQGNPFGEGGDGDGPRMSDPAPPADEPAELVPLVAAFPFDPAGIAPRDWIAPGLLLRRYLSVLVAPPGSGKSLLTLQCGCAAVAGIPWGGWQFRERTRTLVLNAEDDHDEMRRRLFAATQVMGLRQEDLDGLYLAQAPESVVITRTDPKSRAVMRLPLMERLIATIEAQQIGLIIVDPFAETFEGDENSNSEVKWAGIAWREIARRTGAAVWLVHHTRKYASGMAGDADASRGGGALIGTARIVSTLFGMTEEEATAMNVAAEERTQFVRFDDAKANLSLVTGCAKWFRKQSIKLPNGSLGLPGDDVGALVPWSPPGILEGVSVRTIGLLLDTLHRGLLDDTGEPTGRLYTPSPNGADKSRWAGTKIAEMLGCEPDRAKKILKTWLASGLLVDAEYRDKAEGKVRRGLQVDHSKRPDRG